MNKSKSSSTIPPALSALDGVFVDPNLVSLENAPQNMEAAIVGARFVTLRWKPPLGFVGPITSYSVFYKEEGSDR